MAALLILLYVIAANGFTVPTGAFVTAWILLVLKGILSGASSFKKKE